MRTAKKAKTYLKTYALGKVKIYTTGASFTLAYYADKIRKREVRATLADAKIRAAEINRDLEEGRGHVRSFTLEETATINAALEVLRDIRVPISSAIRDFAEAHRLLAGRASVVDAARYFAESRKKDELTPITFDEAAKLFLDRNEKHKLSEAYRNTIRKFLVRACKRLGRSNLLDITTSEIEKAVDSEVSGGPRAFNNFLGAIASVLSHARRQGFLPRAEKHMAELVERRTSRIETIEIYSPGEFSKIIHNISEEAVPFVAISGLAGIRTEEVFRMRWEQVDFKKGFIILGKEFTKTRRRRLVPICDALRSWLEPLHRGAGPIYDLRSSQELGNLLRKAWPRDGDGKALVDRKRNAFRHSYATYRFGLLQDEHRTSSEMGNSPAELREHYAELATPEDATAFFAITRGVHSNIVPMPRRAA